jgi:hypothetical protein
MLWTFYRGMEGLDIEKRYLITISSLSGLFVYGTCMKDAYLLADVGERVVASGWFPEWDLIGILVLFSYAYLFTL